jgi:hypothetical protein
MRIISSLDHRLAYWSGAGWTFVADGAAVFGSYDDAMGVLVSHRRTNHLTDDAWNRAGIVQ